MSGRCCWFILPFTLAFFPPWWLISLAAVAKEDNNNLEIIPQGAIVNLAGEERLPQKNDRLVDEIRYCGC
jgi:hypothetical protein